VGKTQEGKFNCVFFFKNFSKYLRNRFRVRRKTTFCSEFKIELNVAVQNERERERERESNGIHYNLKDYKLLKHKSKRFSLLTHIRRETYITQSHKKEASII